MFIEVTFPDHQDWLAGVAKHLTPSLFAAELRKLKVDVPVYVIHIKARFLAQVRAEVAALGLPRVTVLDPGREVTV